MSTPTPVPAASAQFLELMEGLRGATRMGRARIMAQAATSMRRLSGPQRRILAVEVARQVAPDLVPKIEAVAGGELSARQVGSLLDMLRQLDNDQIAEVARAIRAGELADPEVRAAMGNIATDALAALDSPVPLEALPEPAEPDDAFVVAIPQAVVPAPAAAMSPEVVELAFVPDIAVEVAVDEQPRQQAAAEPAIVPLEIVSVREELQADIVARRALVLDSADGWRRRRVLMTMVRDGQIADDEAVGLIGQLARESDRAWIIGMLLDDELVLIEQVAGLLGPRTLDRMTRLRSAA